MLSEQLLSGQMRQYDEPDWAPLRDLVGMKLADWFMWMHEIELEDGSAVHAYKHIATRRYFHLAVDGRAFIYLSGGFYDEIEPRRAIDLAFETWDGCLTERDDPEETRRELRRARRAATMRGSRRAAEGGTSLRE